MPFKPNIRKAVPYLFLVSAVLLLPFGLPLLLPFLIGLAVALLAEPAVRRLHAKTRLPRGLCCVLTVSGILLLLGAAFWVLLRVLFGEITDLSRRLPELLAQLDAPLTQIRLWLESLVSRLPARTAQSLQKSIADLFSGSSYLMQSLSGWLVGFASSLLSKMPGVLISTVTALIASFLISVSLPELRSFLRRKLPQKRLEHMTEFRSRMKKTLGCWLTAQLELAGISCIVLCAGFLILRVDFWLLCGILTALVDALPVLGAGAVLLPWALIAFLQENTARGIGMLVLYGCMSVLRAALEPRLVGQRMGLHPLISLAAFYVGWRLMGTLGMIVFPIGAILAGELYTLLHPKLQPTLQTEKAQ